MNLTKIPPPIIFNNIPSRKNQQFSVSCTKNVSQKVRTLSLEFRSLPEPIDRVKRLLHYATLLNPLDESLKIQENRVFGCTAQVWLDASLDRSGSVRFGLDSDSEITKGFCSCLVWLLDGAGPDEVLQVAADDLLEMNVGLPSNSRVNAWHNVLIGMQRRTRDLVEERERKEKSCFVLDDFSASMAILNGSCREIRKPGSLAS